MKQYQTVILFVLFERNPKLNSSEHVKGCLGLFWSQAGQGESQPEGFSCCFDNGEDFNSPIWCGWGFPKVSTYPHLMNIMMTKATMMMMMMMMMSGTCNVEADHEWWWMKGFKPWRSCNSACIASHQHHDERDDDADQVDGHDEDEDEENDDEIKLVLHCFPLLCPSSPSQYVWIWSWTFFHDLLWDRCWWEAVGNFGIMKTVTSRIMGPGHFSSFIFWPSAPNVPLNLL